MGVVVSSSVVSLSSSSIITMAKAKSAAAGVESKVGNDIKNKFKQLKKTLSKENIKAKLTRKSSKEISVLTEKAGAANMNSSPPPRTLPQTATKDAMASKSPGVTPIRKHPATTSSEGCTGGCG